ncbi:hypothetical protein GF380_01240, partial [Candidatus Uhrbacteria bacterium]|nr:hypothetical protein [Candidatus Uhrbacteria bacterium]
MAKDITWTHDTIRIGDCELWEENPKQITEAAAKRLLRDWERVGQFQTLAVGPDNEVYDGHQRIKILMAAGYGADYEVKVLRSSRPLTEAERRKVLFASTMNEGHWDFDEFAGWPDDWFEDAGFDFDTLSTWNDQAA